MTAQAVDPPNVHCNKTLSSSNCMLQSPHVDEIEVDPVVEEDQLGQGVAVLEVHLLLVRVGRDLQRMLGVDLVVGVVATTPVQTSPMIVLATMPAEMTTSPIILEMSLSMAPVCPSIRRDLICCRHQSGDSCTSNILTESYPFTVERDALQTCSCFLSCWQY